MKINLKLIKKLIKNPLFILFLIFVFGAVLRLFNIWDNFTFGYDQARDAQRMLDIVNFKNLKLLGQESDIPGVFHGVLSYYVLALAYLIGGFNPNFPAIFLSLINISAIFLIYFTTNILFNDKRVGLLAAFFWAVSYEQINFSKFISNASPMGIASLLFFMGLAIFIFQKKNIGLTISVIGFALSVQTNFYLFYLLIFYVVYFLIFKPKIGLKVLLLNFVLMLALFAPYLIAELKWKFMMTKSLLNYLLSHKQTFDLIGGINRYIIKTSQALHYSLLALGKEISFALFLLFSIFTWFKIKEFKTRLFFFIWLFATAPLFLTFSGVHETQLINTTLFAPLSILAAYVFINIKSAKNIILVLGILIVFVSNMYLLVSDNFKAIRLLSIQNFTLKDEKNLIDYTYASAGGKPFSICALTNPLYINVLWSYLYSTYGKNTYGYVPYWAGQEQVVDSNNLPYDKNHVPLRFIILEPNAGISDFIKPVFIYMEDNTSTLTEEKKYTDLIVQKRILNEDLSTFKDTQSLSKKEIDSIKSIIKANPRFTCYTSYSKDK